MEVCGGISDHIQLIAFIHSYCALSLTMNTIWGTGPFIKNTLCVRACVSCTVYHIARSNWWGLIATDLLLFASLVFQGNVFSCCGFISKTV